MSLNSNTNLSNKKIYRDNLFYSNFEKESTTNALEIQWNTMWNQFSYTTDSISAMSVIKIMTWVLWQDNTRKISLYGADAFTHGILTRLLFDSTTNHLQGIYLLQSPPARTSTFSFFFWNSRNIILYNKCICLATEK